MKQAVAGDLLEKLNRGWIRRALQPNIYLLNTQLVQDIIKNMYTHRNEKKDIKHSGKKHTHIKTL